MDGLYSKQTVGSILFGKIDSLLSFLKYDKTYLGGNPSIPLEYGLLQNSTLTFGATTEVIKTGENEVSNVGKIQTFNGSQYIRAYCKGFDGNKTFD